MSLDWSNKEKIALLSDIMEFGDQPESWSTISNDLYKTFQTKKEGRYSIKNCKQVYKSLLDSYKSEWIENNSINHMKIPLVKFIWKKLKLIYQNEITEQLKDNRKKLQDFYQQFQSTIHLKTNSIPSTPTISNIEIQSQPNDQFNPIENQPQLNVENEINQTTTMEIDPIVSTNDQQLISIVESIDIQQEQIENVSSNEILSEKDHSSSIPIESSSSINPLTQDLQPISSPSIHSNSSSRTNSETKTEHIRIIPTTTTTTTPKYHVYFSPKNSINLTKTKLKRKGNDDLKDDLLEQDNNSNSIEISPTSIEQSKTPLANAPVTRRSISTRSVPNLQAEQEEENARKFSIMITDNPNCWQAQSMAIIQYLRAHKQGYLFEYEITDEIAPNYHKYIRHPIALNTIRKNLESNQYLTSEFFKKDIFLMLYNAMKYNPRHHHVHKSARLLFNLILPLFQLSSQDIQSHITNKTNLSLTINQNDHPLVKRKRIK